MGLVKEITCTKHECSERLLELFFSDEVRGAKELVLMLCEGSTDIRDRMGDAHVIQKVVESADDSVMNCKLLASFAQEAWGRADLRESGALDFLVSHLAATPFNSADRQAVVQPLRHFVHDTNGMAHLVRNRLFVSTVVKDVQEFLAENQVICKPEIVKEEDFIFRPDSPLLMEIESELQRKEGDDSALLHKDYSALWSYSTYSSPSLTRWSSHSSPTYSPPSSGPASPVCSSSASPWTSPHSSNSRLSDLGGEASEGETSRAASCVDTVRADNVAVERVIESELWLLTWQAQEDTNLPYLGTEDVVNAVLSYLALAPAPDYRIGRVLRRLASSRHSIDSLLTIQFHTRVLHTLCTSPCRVVREFASHVDSDFGNSFLIKRLTSDDFNTRVVAAIAKVALIRDRFRLGRMSSGRLPALDLLFDSIRTLLLREDFEEIAYETTYVDGPPICAQMVGAISTLISSKRLREILEVDSAVRPQERGECVIEKNTATPDVSVEMLVFETKDGEVLARVPMAAACKNSRYFEGMFNSDLLEKSSGRRTFVFCPDEEGCSAEDFTRFLHYLAGCRSHCTTISSPVAGVALVTLSDRYLCNSLSDFICSPHGPVRRILTGETLGTFLPAVLSTQTHDRTRVVQWEESY
ncbi:unnamed protein product [Nippostrongylus brasiliensis]|uniref:BTB domain-containing protein n=1 Tax=Nippostrongylus brasiliensis TaxID=27835 RepID=A0A0N4YK30_NIPBR|nr:unnamed protein product [Nippostrongylus brasiliensis]